MSPLRRLWEGWKRLVHRIGIVQTFIFMTLFYFLVLGVTAIVLFVTRRDLLHLRARAGTFYRDHPPFDDSVERYTHLT